MATVTVCRPPVAAPPPSPLTTSLRPDAVRIDPPLSTPAGTPRPRTDPRTPLTLVLRLLAERTPEEQDGIRFGLSMDADQGVVEIALGPDTMELFQGDGRAGHSLLGGILHDVVARLRAARGDDPGSSTDEFRAAWDSCHP